MKQPERTALVVDDEPQVRNLTCRALTSSGFLCDQASDGAQAIQMATDKAYDAVVTDLRMPNRHGHAFCTDVLKLQSPPQVFVLTALGDARLVRDLMSRGVQEVMHKPMPYDLLASKVLTSVQQRKINRLSATEGREESLVADRLRQLKTIETTLKEFTVLFGERLDPLFCETDDLPELPQAIQEFIRRLSKSESLGSEVLGDHSSRTRVRAPCFTIATAVPVDRRWNPVYEPFKIAIRDLSESGVRMVHTRATPAKYLALSWEATQLFTTTLRVVAQVMRNKPCGRFYDIGGQFTLAD